MTEQTSAEPSVPVPQVLPAQDVLFVVTPELTEREIRRQRVMQRERGRKREDQRRRRAEGREKRKEGPRDPGTVVVDSAPVVEWVTRLIAREAGLMGYSATSPASKATKTVCDRLGVPERSLFRWRTEGSRIQLALLDKMLTRSDEYLWWDVYGPHHGEAYIRVQEFFEGSEAVSP